MGVYIVKTPIVGYAINYVEASSKEQALSNIVNNEVVLCEEVYNLDYNYTDSVVVEDNVVVVD